MNSVAFIGRLTRDVEMRYLPSGVAVANFNIAVEKGLSRSKKKEMEAQGKKTADFFNCVAFDGKAEVIHDYFTKGDRIGISGKLSDESYKNKDGVYVNKYSILVGDIDFIEVKSENNKNKDVVPEKFDTLNEFDDIGDDDIPF